MNESLLRINIYAKRSNYAQIVNQEEQEIEGAIRYAYVVFIKQMFESQYDEKYFLLISSSFKKKTEKYLRRLNEKSNFDIWKT